MNNKEDRDSALTRLRGPYRFVLHRSQDPNGVSGTGHVATGVMFSSGQCVLHWRDGLSLSVHPSIDEVERIHGHEGKTTVEWIDPKPTEAYLRGKHDCYQDSCEGCLVAGVQGLPVYISDEDEKEEYAAGYSDMAAAEFGVHVALVSK